MFVLHDANSSTIPLVGQDDQNEMHMTFLSCDAIGISIGII